MAQVPCLRLLFLHPPLRAVVIFFLRYRPCGMQCDFSRHQNLQSLSPSTCTLAILMSTFLSPYGFCEPEGLESNLPHMLMQFSDTPFPEKTQLFPKWKTVLRYLRDYASDVILIIKFRYQVIDVRPSRDEERHVWKVTVRAAAGGVDEVERFDAVVAANGRYDWPLLPHIEGLDAWSREFLDSLYHSVSYKNAKAFENKVSRLVVDFLIHFP